MNKPKLQIKIIRLIHWIIACSMVACYFVGLIMNHITGHKAFYLYDIHVQIGLSLLLFVMIRTYWKYVNSYKKTFSGLKLSGSITTGYLYLCLYSLMLTICILGIIFIQAKGRHLAFLELIDLPNLTDVKPKIFTRLVFNYHKWLSHTVIIMACLHIITKLKYQLLQLLKLKGAKHG